MSYVPNAALGTPGSAVPAIAEQIAGSDGTDLRTILTDATGQVKVLVENSPTVAISGTVPVSGTVTADVVGHAGATLDGTAGSPSTGVLTVQGVSGGTAQPVSLATLPALTAGTAVIGKVEIEGNAGAILDGTAGSPSAGVLTVQGVSGGTAQPVTIAGSQSVNVAQALGSTLSKTNGVFVVPGDNTNSITMKAASTQSATTDTSLVVQINPNQPNLTTALNVQDTADGPVSAGSAATKSTLTGGVVATSAASGTAAQQMATQMDVAGCVRVNPAGQTGSFKSYSNTVAGNVQNVITVGAGKKWILKSVVIIVETNATAGTRTPSCYIQDASSRVMCNINAGVGTTATSASTYFNFAPSMPLSTSVISSCVTVPLPEFALGPSATVNGNVTGGLAGDSSLMTICVIEYND